ncbi:hypothetical protein C4585_02210 [Candidatus Parcubacteria bacterium]|nr:MAG: hypothetical protein C4585_02210 [Candidatus Parcubacteria bacterium]
MSGKKLAIVALLVFACAVASVSGTYAASSGSVKITGVVNGGRAQPSDFTLQIRFGNSSVSGSGNNITFSGLAAGFQTITMSEGPAGYRVAWSGDCNSQGTVLVIPNITRNCTATYVYGSLGTIVVNTVVNGGTATASDFTVHLKKEGEADTGSPSGSGSVVTFDQLIPGEYTVIQSTLPAGYTAVWSGACDDGNVTVVGNRTATCTVTNTYTSASEGRTERGDRAPRTRTGR